MLNTRNLLLMYYNKFIIMSTIYNNDISSIILIIIILFYVLKSKEHLMKMYGKINSKLNKIKEGAFPQKIDKKLNYLPEDKINQTDLPEDKTNQIDLSEDKTNETDLSDINNFKNNIKLIYKKKDELEEKLPESNPYMNEKDSLYKKYYDEVNNNNFKINVNSTICSTPIFNLRSYKDLGFHYNFLIHNFCPKKINNLIMCKDIHQWMATSSLSSEDLEDELVPIYFIKKTDNITDVYEYLKLFIHTDKNGLKAAFVQKGNDFLFVKDDIDELISKYLIKDLLEDKHYNNYNLSIHEGVSSFLDKFLSLVLIPEHCIGDNIDLDIKNYHENHNTFEYFFNTLNSDVSVFATTI